MEFFWCIAATVCIGVCFKLFARYGINTFNAIVINYTVCLGMGTLLDPADGVPFSTSVTQAPWFRYDVVLGLIFIIGFNLTALGIRTSGITLTTLVQRMSLILTVSFAVVMFHEHFGWLELIGLLLAISAILTINQKKEQGLPTAKTRFPYILLTILLFSAMVEIMLLYVEKSGVVGTDQMAFTTHGFGSAGILGWVILIAMLILRKTKLTGRDVLAGLILGIPNYFSIYLLLVMLNKGWNGSIMYPLVNVTVLLISTFVAVLFFREKLSRMNWLGIGLAAASILLISYAHNREDWKTIF